MNRFVAILALLGALPVLALDFCHEQVEQYSYVYMRSTAVPTKVAALRPIQGTFYDPSAADGMRLRVRTAVSEYYLPGYDWQIKPLIEFVEAGSVEAVKATLTEYGMDLLYAGPFIDRLLSVRLLQAMLVGRGYFIEEQDLNASGVAAAPAPGEVAGELFAGIENRQLIFDVLSQTAEPTYSSLADIAQTFRYSYTEQGQIEMSGRPYFAYWEKHDGEVRVNRGLGPKVDKIWADLMKCNPMAMKTMVQAYQTTAFLRMLSKTVPQDWQHLVESYRRVVVPVVKSPHQIVLYE
jgi:hypothetical protein